MLDSHQHQLNAFANVGESDRTSGEWHKNGGHPRNRTRISNGIAEGVQSSFAWIVSAYDRHDPIGVLGQFTLGAQ